MAGDGAELIAQALFGAVGVAVHVPVKRLDEEESSVELVAQFVCEGEIELAVELHTVESCGAERGHDVVEILGVENADFGQVGREFRHEFGDLSGGDAARTRREDKADSVGAIISCEGCVFGIRVGADLNPHGSGGLRFDYGSGGLDETQERLEGRAGMRLAHERFADEAGVKTGGVKTVEVVGGVDATFRNADGVWGELADEFEGSFEAHIEGAEVAVVDAVGVTAEIADEGQLFGGVNFAKNVEVERMRGCGEAAELGAGKCGRDEEDSVGMMGAGLDNLVLVHDEVFAEAGDLRDCGGDLEVAQAALEEGLVGENGEGGGSGIFEAGGQRLRVELRANQTLRGRRFFELGDDGGSGSGGITESAGEAPRLVGGRGLFEEPERSSLAALVHVGAGLGEDAVKMQGFGL